MSEDVLAQICNEAGVCAPVDPLTALILIGLQTIGDEINKGNKGFGPNGAVINAVNTIFGDLKNGMGPNNDLVKAWETVKNDLTNGLGDNNDIVKFLASMNVRL